MSTQTIESAGSRPGACPPATIGEQRDALAILAQLADAHASLPLPYITVHTTGTSRVNLQLPTPDAFEQWRTALHVDASTVTLHSYGGGQWLKAETQYIGATVELSGMGVRVSDEQRNEPRDLAEEQPPAEVVEGPLCGSVRYALPCILAADHEDRGVTYHRDKQGQEWPTAAASATKLRTVLSLSERGGQS